MPPKDMNKKNKTKQLKNKQNKGKQDKKKNKPQQEEFDCTKLAEGGGQMLNIQGDDKLFSYNWVEILCYPYILCGKLWECCITLCAGTNQCLVCWLILQWIMCKIKNFGTPDPVLFPYYFYMFCQVVFMGLGFVCLWLFFGKPVIYPYLLAAYKTLTEKEAVVQDTRRMSLKRYCFKKVKFLIQILTMHLIINILLFTSIQYVPFYTSSHIMF